MGAARGDVATGGTIERAGLFGLLAVDGYGGCLVARVASSLRVFVIEVWGWSVFFFFQFFHFFNFFPGRSLGLNAWKSQDFSDRLGGGRVWG
jgi:hypothetical protein